MRKIIFLLFTILAAWQVKAADKVRFVAEAADVVVSGTRCAWYSRSIRKTSRISVLLPSRALTC